MNLCTECGLLPKYKCPVCWQPYCSISCCQKHKEVPCTAPVREETSKEQTIESRTDYEFPTEDTVPVEKLKLLGNSTELKKYLRDPYLRKMLSTLDQATHPDEKIQEYMLNPIFTEFVDECLKIVQPQSQD